MSLLCALSRLFVFLCVSYSPNTKYSDPSFLYSLFSNNFSDIDLMTDRCCRRVDIFDCSAPAKPRLGCFIWVRNVVFPPSLSKDII